LARGLKAALGANNVAVQGVEYAAGIGTNLLPNNADPRGVANMRNLILEANRRCPNSAILTSGYSQGAAITHAAMENLPAAALNQIAGAALFGDTRNLQERGQIAGYPQEKTLIICNPGDLVCVGTLTITPAHLAYGPRVPEATRFLAARVQGSGVIGRGPG
jgi:cutinase